MAWLAIVAPCPRRIASQCVTSLWARGFLATEHPAPGSDSARDRHSPRRCHTARRCTRTTFTSPPDHHGRVSPRRPSPTNPHETPLPKWFSQLLLVSMGQSLAAERADPLRARGPGAPGPRSPHRHTVGSARSISRTTRTSVPESMRDGSFPSMRSSSQAPSSRRRPRPSSTAKAHGHGRLPSSRTSMLPQRSRRRSPDHSLGDHALFRMVPRYEVLHRPHHPLRPRYSPVIPLSPLLDLGYHHGRVWSVRPPHPKAITTYAGRPLSPSPSGGRSHHTDRSWTHIPLHSSVKEPL